MALQGSFQDTFGKYMPTFSKILFQRVIIGIVIIILAAVGTGVALYFYVQKKVFNKTIIVFEKIAGRWEDTMKIKAREVRYGEAGDTCFLLKRNLKGKKYLPTPKVQTGRNKYWYAIREDGEWINVGMGDIDTQMRQVNAHFLDTDMRYARVSLQGKLKERYDQVTFWQKYGGMIAWTGLIALLGIFAYLIFGKFIHLANQLNSAIEAGGEVVKAAKDTLVALNNVQSGSGLVPA